MSDYNKLNIRYSNKGLNVEYSPNALSFGQWAVFKNVYTQYEGEVTGRRGLLAQSSNAITGAIIGIQQLNDWINNYFTYVVKSTNGKWYFSTTDGTHATTTPTFQFADTGAAAGSSTFGSFIVGRPPLSAQTWIYVGDANFHLKFGLSSSGTLSVKNMGITRPLIGSFPTLSQVSGGSLTASSTYYYRYTLLDKNTGVESLYNSTENKNADGSLVGQATDSGAHLTINVVIPAETVDSSVTHVRVYRSGGTLPTWNRISDDSATYAYTGSSINFNDAASDLSITAATLLDTISDKPFSVTKPDNTVVAGSPVKYLFGPYLGYVLAVGDPFNPGFVYWTNKFTPDMQNPANNIEVSSPQDPLQNGFVYDGKPYVFSKESLWALYAGISSQTAFTPSKTACGRGLWTPHAFVVGPQIFFLSKDGIYATSGGLEQALTDNELRPIFDPKQTATSINGIGVVDYTQVNYMFMAYYKQEIFFQYFGKDGNTNLLIYDIRYRRWRHMLGSGQGASVRCMYTDTQAVANLVFGGNDGFQYQESGSTFTDGGVAIPGEIKTGIITLDTPLIHKEWGALVVDLNPNGATVTINVYTNRGASLIDLGGGFTGQTSATSRTRLFIDLQATFAEDIQIDISWSTSLTPPIFYSYELFYRPDVPSMTSWRVTGVTHGILGWQIVRSAYLTLVSDGNLTLTVTSLLDNSTVAKSYTISGTSSTRKKVFVPFDPIKGKLFNYQLSLNGASFFRLYGEDSEIHVKPWISSFGYKAVNPFKEEGAIPLGGGLGQQSGTTQGPGLGGGGDTSGADLAAAISPIFQYSGLGGGSPLGPAQSDPTGSNNLPDRTNAPSTPATTPTAPSHGLEPGA